MKTKLRVRWICAAWSKSNFNPEQAAQPRVFDYSYCQDGDEKHEAEQTASKDGHMTHEVSVDIA